MSKDKITGQDRERDEAEKWLKDNDPDYDKTHRGWQTPSTDFTARNRSEHESLRDWKTLDGEGNYRKRQAASHENNDEADE